MENAWLIPRLSQRAVFSIPVLWLHDNVVHWNSMVNLADWLIDWTSLFRHFWQVHSKTYKNTKMKIPMSKNIKTKKWQQLKINAYIT